ncbi:MAG TPA: hypothetical protein VGF77_06050 [Allosphingosinicella sp.]|jgi:hypothetical protein
MHLLSLWALSDSTLKAALIEAAATLTAAFFGFGAVIAQIGFQGRHSRRAVAENERQKLKAAMYEDALIVCREMSDAAIELSNALMIMDMNLNVASHAVSARLGYNIPTARFPSLSVGYNKFSDAAIKVIFLVENWRIIEPRLLVFRTALNSVLHDTREIMFSEFVINLMHALPVDNPQGGIFPYAPPEPAQYQVIHTLTARFMDALGDATAYADDLLVELQKLLLGDLFKHRLEARKPADPSKKAIVLDQADELEQWFRTSTAWGAKMAAVEAETRARFSELNPNVHSRVDQ